MQLSPNLSPSPITDPSFLSPCAEIQQEVEPDSSGGLRSAAGGILSAAGGMAVHEPVDGAESAALTEQRVLRPMPISGFDPSENSVFFPEISRRREGRVFRRRGPKVEVQAYTVQCAMCLSWREVPSAALYESIRQRVSEQPWYCEDAQAWDAAASCSRPSDLQMQSSSQDTIWALDKPDLPATPAGWKRDLVIRSQGSTKFADIYYTSPCGKKLRSMVEIRKFLEDNPRYKCLCVSEFCFTTPQPVDKSYVRKRKDSPISLQNQMKALRDTPDEDCIPPPVPPGWSRELVIRSYKSSKYSDVFYVTPCNIKIRSLVEMNEFLHKYPSYVFQGVSLDQFSFAAPSSDSDIRKIELIPGCIVRTAMTGSINHPVAKHLTAPD